MPTSRKFFVRPTASRQQSQRRFAHSQDRAGRTCLPWRCVLHEFEEFSRDYDADGSQPAPGRELVDRTARRFRMFPSPELLRRGLGQRETRNESRGNRESPWTRRKNNAIGVPEFPRPRPGRHLSALEIRRQENVVGGFQRREISGQATGKEGELAR